jgi:C1A family cysteine protease
MTQIAEIKWGRRKDRHDVRDHIFKSRQRLSEVPTSVDLSPWEGSVFDQGNYGSCTGNAGAGVSRLIYKKYLNADREPSRAYIYDKERILDGTFPQDVGSEMRMICKTLTKFGFALESDYPYNDADLTTAPSPEVDGIAIHHHDLGGYHRLSGAVDAVLCLGDPVPWPVLIGFTVYQSFERIGPDGMMPLPTAGEWIMGGHAVYARGYDRSKAYDGGVGMVLCRNSWGPDWGMNGDFWMPLEILDQSDTDLWIIHLGGPWKKPS